MCVCVRAHVCGAWFDASHAHLQDEDVRTAEVVGWFWDADEAEKAGTANRTGFAKWAQEVKKKVSGRSEAGVLETYLQLALKRQKRLNEHETLAIARALGPRHLHLIAFSAATGRVRSLSRPTHMHARTRIMK